MVSDPEVQQLTATISLLTRQAQELSTDISHAVDELVDFTRQIILLDSRKANLPFRGRDRRNV